MVNSVSREKLQKRLIFQWTTFKGLAAILLFLTAIIVIEYVVVVYAISLGVQDETLLQWSFQFPGTDWIITMAISPLFHLVPIAVIIALVCNWAYLTRYVAVKPPEKWKGQIKPVTKQRIKSGLKGMKKLASKIKGIFRRIKSGLLRIKGVAYLWQKIHFARATIKSASTVLLIFGALILLVSLLMYPQLIYWTVSNAYQKNPSLLGLTKSVSNFGKGVADALAPVNWICSAVNNALLSVSPGFRDFVLSLGYLIKPMVELDGAGKYLVFQNVAALVSAVVALFYGGYRRKSYRYKRGRRR